MKNKSIWTRFRDAVTGRFTNKAVADQRPRETVSERYAGQPKIRPKEIRTQDGVPPKCDDGSSETVSQAADRFRYHPSQDVTPPPVPPVMAVLPETTVMMTVEVRKDGDVLLAITGDHHIDRYLCERMIKREVGDGDDYDLYAVKIPLRQITG